MIGDTRKQWREEAHKRTCGACLRRSSRSEWRPFEVRGWQCPDCGGAGYTIATPVTRAQLEAHIARWQRDRLAECDDEPAMAWFAGNAALVANLEKANAGILYAMSKGPSMKEQRDGARRLFRAAVAAIPDGPWCAPVPG